MVERVSNLFAYYPVGMDLSFPTRIQFQKGNNQLFIYICIMVCFFVRPWEKDRVALIISSTIYIVFLFCSPPLLFKSSSDHTPSEGLSELSEMITHIFEPCLDVSLSGMWNNNKPERKIKKYVFFFRGFQKIPPLPSKHR